MKELKHSLEVFTLVLFAALVALSAATVYADDRLNPGEILRRGEYLTSGNRGYTLILQQDGNLVLYDARKHPLWASGTQGKRVERCIMQRDGNLVLYLDNGQPVWASRTDGKPGSFLVLQNDGNLVIYQRAQPVWASNTERGQGDRDRGDRGIGPLYVEDLDMNPDPANPGQDIRFRVRLRNDGRPIRGDIRIQDKDQVVVQVENVTIPPGSSDFQFPYTRYSFQRFDHCFKVLVDIERTPYPVDAEREFCARPMRWTLRP
jgi:hypothetical protein